MLTENDLKTLSSTACKAAIAAGAYIQSQFDQHYDKKHKEGGDSHEVQVTNESLLTFTSKTALLYK